TTGSAGYKHKLQYVAHVRGIGFSRSVRLTGALKALLATLFCFALGGCLGYHIGPVKPYYLRDVHTIAVPTFKNRTLVPRIEVLVTDTVIKQLQQDGTYQVANGDKADATLTGEVALIRRLPERSVRGNVLATTDRKSTRLTSSHDQNTLSLTTLFRSHTIAVPTFKNRTLVPRIEVLVTDTVIKQLQQDGTFQVANGDKADATLTGEVALIRRLPARSVRGNVLATTEFSLALSVKYSLTGRDGKDLAPPGQAVGTTSFFVSSDVTSDERQALPLATEDLATRLVSQLSEGW